ncbi:MAG TPA: hypothetical protein VLA72_04010 [Anaerolineales bacterium]|nr:hypothetical protein [Anaerolineales bacterium]
MKRLASKVMIGMMLLAISACGQEPALTPPDQLESNGQSEALPKSTVGAMNTAVVNDESAYNILVQFFDHLHTGRYEEAVNLYGGDYQLLIDQNPGIDSAEHATLMKNACMYNGYQCLKVKLAGIERKPSPDEYIFGVQFQNEDGSPFVLGPCCGASETEQPPVAFFEIRVMKIAEGEFRVMDMPPFLP